LYFLQKELSWVYFDVLNPANDPF